MTPPLPVAAAASERPAFVSSVDVRSTPKTLLELAGVHRAAARLSRSVIVVVDAQRDYVDGKLPLPGIAAATAELHRLLERARQLGTPIVHVQQLSPAGRGAFEEGTPGAAFADAATPRAGETIVTKKLPNSFAGTPLADVLRSLGRSELIVVGYMTHMCVSTTARAALDNGYAVTVVADACATRDLPAPGGGVVPAAVVHRVALAELADRFAVVVSRVDEIRD